MSSPIRTTRFQGPGLTVKVLGTPVSVGLGFPLVMGTVGWLSTHDAGRFTAFFLLVTASVLIHEGGHAAALRVFGFSPSIALTPMGGLTSSAEHRRIAPWASIVVSIAGPAAAVVFGLLLEVVLAAGRSPDLVWFRHLSLLVNFGWSAFNLIPIMPLDGGHVVRELAQRAIRERGRAIPEAVFAIAAICGLIAWILRDHSMWALVIIALMFLSCLPFLDLTERQRQAYRLAIAHEQLLAGDLSAGIDTLLPVALSQEADRINTEAYTTLAWALLHERRYVELAALDPNRFHDHHQGLLTGATYWFKGDLPRATSYVLDSLGNGSVDPPETYFERTFLRFGEFDRLSASAATLPPDRASRAVARLKVRSLVSA